MLLVPLVVLTFLPEVESRTQGSRPRPRTQKKIRGQGQGQPFRRQTLSRPRTGMLEAKDRNARGQGPETQAQILSKKKRSTQKFFKRSPKKKVCTKIFQAISTKKRFPKKFSSAPRNFNNSKNTAVLKPRTGQFSRTWGLEAKDFKMCPRGLHLCFLLHHVQTWIYSQKAKITAPFVPNGFEPIPAPTNELNSALEVAKRFLIPKTNCPAHRRSQGSCPPQYKSGPSNNMVNRRNHLLYHF